MKFLSFGALQGFSGTRGLPLFLPVFGFRDMTDFFTGNRDPIPPWWAHFTFLGISKFKHLSSSQIPFFGVCAWNLESNQFKVMEIVKCFLIYFLAFQIKITLNIGNHVRGFHFPFELPFVRSRQLSIVGADSGRMRLETLSYSFNYHSSDNGKHRRARIVLGWETA